MKRSVGLHSVHEGIGSTGLAGAALWESLRPALALAVCLLLGAIYLGCQADLDRLYVLPLDDPPTEADWEASVGLELLARGGRTSQRSEADVDSDAVHASTASCHHGAEALPVRIKVRAFHTRDRLYLRFEWADPTADRGPSWAWDGTGWRAGDRREDGLGILWGRDAERFSCARACHLEDWRVAGPRAFADYAMASPAGATPLDFWVWRAGRGRIGGMADDGRLGPQGREGDGPGDLFIPNSVRARTGADGAFSPGDTPWEAPEPEPGAQAPAYLALPGPAGRIEVSGHGERGRGTWRVTISRALLGTDPEDVRFTPGREYVFGLATLDGVEIDHNAVAGPIRMVLVERSTLRPLAVVSKE
jgi:hypothetical protein